MSTPDLSGQTVNLLGPDGKTVIATTTTNANGSYTFGNVAPGADTVQFVAKPGDTFSTPSSDPVTVTSGSSSTVNAGEYAPSTISGTVFNDLNADGSQETANAGLAGQTVNLLGSDGQPSSRRPRPTPTAAYSFGNVVAGADTVQIVGSAGRHVLHASPRCR